LTGSETLLGQIWGSIVGPTDSVTASVLLVASVAVPLLVATAFVSDGLRRHASWLLLLAPIPALLAAILLREGTALVVLSPPFRLSLAVDTAGGLLLGGAAILWLAAGRFAVAFLRADPTCDRFLVWWLFTMAGSFAVFLVADLASFYLAYALVSFSAFGLVVHDDSPEARRAGSLYLSLTVLGEAFLIAAFVMLAAGIDQANPLIREAVAALPTSPWQSAILLLLLLGFTLKMGLFPLHIWMPLAHSVAPAPGSAALSGIVVKAGVIGLIRFIPEGFPMPVWGMTLAAFGMVTAFYGVAIGLTQRHPKRALAYSTVSQMGVVGVVLGAGLETGSGVALLLAAFYALNHMLLKGSMFLAVGLASAGGKAERRIGVLLMAMLGLGLAGLPLTGGAFAKYAIKAAPTSGTVVFLLTLSAAGTAALMLHVVILLLGSDGKAGKNKGLVGPCAVLSLIGMALPAVLFPAVTGVHPSAALSADALFGAAWPIALGAALALLVYRLRDRIPQVPAGDLFVLASRLAPAVARVSGMAADVDRALGRWQVAGITVLGLVLVLSTVMLVQVR